VKPFARKLAAAGVALALAQPAFAVLQRTGPVDPVHGYPAWYQDANGLALELCSPTTAADLNAGICAVLPGVVPAGLDPANLPEVFPTNWSLEHFYYLVSSKTTTSGLDRTGAPVAGAGALTFIGGVEASFNTPLPEAGQQITFSRWRIFHTNPACTGNYTYYTPHRAPKTVAGVAGVRIGDTEDIGIGPDFNGALNGSNGPFAMRASTPGGAPVPFATGADGKKYLSPGDLGPITGSAVPNAFLNSTLTYIPPEIRTMPMTNYVMVVGPGVTSGNCAVTEAAYSINDLTVLGRINTQAIASRTIIDRATYRAVDTNADGTPDRFQIGAWANAVQEVGRPEPIVALSLNKGDPADPVNSTAELAMLKTPVVTTAPTVPGQVATPKFNFFNGIVQPTVAGQPGPAFNHARVRTTTDAPPTVVNVPLVDELRITAANYNANTKVLTVTADSGAFLSAPTPAGQLATNALCSTPCLTLDSYGLPTKDALGAAIDFKMKVAATSKFAVATVTIPNVQVPPAFVTVRSSAGGVDSAQTMYLGAAAGTASFQPDSASTAMNVPVTVDVLANDVGVAAVPNLLVCTALTGGTCAVPNPTATCTVGTATTNCTAQGGKLVIGAGNTVTYTPRANFGGVTDTFYYQAATVLGTTQRQRVDVAIGNINGLPDARDDLGNTAVVGQPVTIDVLANDFALAGVNLASLQFTSQPQNLTTGVTGAGSAVFTAGKLVFTPPSAGTWNMAYTFTDNAGILADQGVVAVNAIGAEVIAVQRALWRAGRAPALGTVAVNGTVNIAQGQTLNLYVPNAATGAAGCNNPRAGQLIGSTPVVAGGAYDFGAIALAVRPATVYVFSPTFGGCTQVTVQ